MSNIPESQGQNEEQGDLYPCDIKMWIQSIVDLLWIQLFVKKTTNLYLYIANIDIDIVDIAIKFKTCILDIVDIALNYKSVLQIFQILILILWILLQTCAKA